MNKYKCGMCPSCYQRDYCPVEPEGLSCSNYLQPEPTKSQWPEIYEKAILDAERALKEETPDIQCKAIGTARSIKRALRTLHGFTETEIKTMEDRVKIPREKLKEILGG